MIEDHLQQLRSAIEQASLPDDYKSKLLNLVATVEVDVKEQSQPQQAGQDSAAEPEADGAIHRLVASIDGLEATHPKITDLINQVALGLSKMGF